MLESEEEQLVWRPCWGGCFKTIGTNDLSFIVKVTVKVMLTVDHASNFVVLSCCFDVSLTYMCIFLFGVEHREIPTFQQNRPP